MHLYAAVTLTGLIGCFPLAYQPVGPPMSATTYWLVTIAIWSTVFLVLFLAKAAWYQIVHQKNIPVMIIVCAVLITLAILAVRFLH